MRFSRRTVISTTVEDQMPRIVILCLCMPVLQAATEDQIRSSASRAVALVQQATIGFYNTPNLDG
jgi:hypothetical protein